ncbi:hypothetical protein [Malaciobacter mytili]|uniref:Uncharacterized protein n=1 Tax=Malaciobacter mytili LMG 24559 TaxID=1032238 RepID=A0AAX2AKU3_9BACT|nr:hypothetical protein [Malaciobacter mytili]AXH15055.1 hypothetical protein AMYT_1479 [Malaciobacter mytili LMG 24559]RXI43979.1 hypothetical protein CRU99_06025 [Malaciobacter mytili]RXK16738.1 hypothetical protein CP985_02030 [Malaciobacter mytili LMG 24559]
MTKQISKNILFNTFKVEDFTSLEEVINNMPPSVVEYYLDNLDQIEDNSYLNKRDIEHSLYFGNYSLYLDYSDNIYLEIDIKDEETDSFW